MDIPQMKPTGRIIDHLHTSDQGFRYRTYSWEGGPLIEITHALARQSRISADRSVLWVGPYRLRVVGPADDRLGRYIICCRIDVWYSFLWMLAWWAAMAFRWWSDRMLLTLAVWGIADPRMIAPEGLWDMSWRHIRGYQWCLRHVTAAKRICLRKVNALLMLLPHK